MIENQLDRIAHALERIATAMETPEKTAPAPEAELMPEPEPEPEPTPAVETAPELDLQKFKAKIVGAGRSCGGYSTELKAILSRYSTDGEIGLSHMSPKDYPAILSEAEALAARLRTERGLGQ